MLMLGNAYLSHYEIYANIYKLIFTNVTNNKNKLLCMLIKNIDTLLTIENEHIDYVASQGGGQLGWSRAMCSSK